MDKIKIPFTFKEFCDMSEITKEPVKVEWNKTDSKWRGVFFVDDTKFIITIELHADHNVWSFKFSDGEGNTHLTNSVTKPYVVKATIVNSCLAFFNEVKPRNFLYVGAIAESSRIRKYDIQSLVFAKLEHFFEKSFIVKDYKIYLLCKVEEDIDSLEAAAIEIANKIN